MTKEEFDKILQIVLSDYGGGDSTWYVSPAEYVRACKVLRVRLPDFSKYFTNAGKD